MEIYTTAEAATLLETERRNVQNAAKIGTLQGTRKGRDWLFTRAQLEQFRATRRKPGRPSKPEPPVSP